MGQLKRQVEAAEQEEQEKAVGPALSCLAWALKILEMAREEEQAALRRRRSLAWRARVAAERLLDHMERHPDEANKDDLAGVVGMLRLIREEESAGRSGSGKRRCGPHGGAEVAEGAPTRLAGGAVAT